jgi:predicted dehydrogenase
VIAAAAGDTVTAVADLDPARAEGAAAAVGASWTTNWREVVESRDVDAVVVATVNRELCPIGTAALGAGKHVLCEKPLGRNATEAEALVTAATLAGVVLKCGLNHRHHPALARAHEIAEDGGVGPLFTVRAAYGHGGRPGYEQEWRGDPELAGGGELLDQGVHLIDLSRWFLGDFTEVIGATATWFWDVSPLEDNCFATLSTGTAQIASLHSSWTQWRNMFRFEVFGRDGYLQITGLGGSYGPERLVHGRRRKESGPPHEESWDFPDRDVSWELEWQEFRSAITEGRRPLGDGRDGLAAAIIIDGIYESVRTRASVSLDSHR